MLSGRSFTVSQPFIFKYYSGLIIAYGQNVVNNIKRFFIEFEALLPEIQKNVVLKYKIMYNKIKKNTDANTAGEGIILTWQMKFRKRKNSLSTR